MVNWRYLDKNCWYTIALVLGNLSWSWGTFTPATQKHFIILYNLLYNIYYSFSIHQTRSILLHIFEYSAIILTMSYSILCNQGISYLEETRASRVLSKEHIALSRAPRPAAPGTAAPGLVPANELAALVSPAARKL